MRAVVVATLLGAKPANCRALSWSAQTTDLVIDVLCRNIAGAVADSSFLLHYSRDQGTKGLDTGPVAYVAANKPTKAAYTPGQARNFSSGGTSAHVERTGLGRYMVTLPDMPVGGAAFVTPYGSGKSHCSVSSIRTSGLPQRIGVRCFTPDGDRVDSEFGLTYLR